MIGRTRTIPLLISHLACLLLAGSASGWSVAWAAEPQTAAPSPPATPTASPSREVDLTPVGGSTSTPRPAAVSSEGAIVTMLPGTLLWDAKGGLIFKPDAATDGATAAFSQPASLLPSAALARFESMLGVGTSDNNSPPPSSTRSSKDGHPVPEDLATRELGRYYINGQVFAFHGRPYILLSVPPTQNAVLSGNTPAVSPTAASPGSKPATPNNPAAPLKETADVQSLITELESRRTTARALETAADVAVPNSDGPKSDGRKSDGSAAQPATDSSTNAATDPNTSPRTASRPDGQHINGRQGRVVRHDAWLIFTPDSGTRSPSDQPLVLLPSAQMERLEGLVYRYGDSARYRISGKLVSYKGRTFLLPTLAQVMPPSDLSPGQ